MGHEAILALSAGDLVTQFWPVIAISFLVSVASTPICRRFARRHAIVDKPDEFLKPHGKPIPYLGGVAIYLGWLAGILVALKLLNLNVNAVTIVGITIAGTAIVLIGLFDDLRVMQPRVKLIANVAVALLLVGLGLGHRLIRILNGTFVGDEWLELLYSVPVAVFIVVGACNATNLIDGLDGLCSGVLGIISIGFVLLAAHLQLNPTARTSPMADERLVLSLAMLGAAAGFLPYNLNPATIFMGDAGSMLLGLNSAILILMFAEVELVRWMIGALMVFGLPTADMMLSMARRWRNGRPLMQGDRSHFYDQLRDRGLSVRKVVAVSYVLSIAFVLVGTSVMYLRTRYAILVFFIAILAAVAGVWRFNMVSIERNARVEPERSESTL